MKTLRFLRVMALYVLTLTTVQGQKMYTDCNFRGDRHQFEPPGVRESEYNLGALVLPNDRVSSLQITPGTIVTLYEDANFGGQSIELISDIACLSVLNFNDKMSSFKIRDFKVTLFGECGFGGASAQTFTIGSYNWDQIRIPNDALSSVRVPAGLTVTLYENANFTGRSLELNSDISCLDSRRFDNIMSSFVVSRAVTSITRLKVRLNGFFADACGSEDCNDSYRGKIAISLNSIRRGDDNGNNTIWQGNGISCPNPDPALLERNGRPSQIRNTMTGWWYYPIDGTRLSTDVYQLKLEARLGANHGGLPSPAYHGISVEKMVSVRDLLQTRSNLVNVGPFRTTTDRCHEYYIQLEVVPE